MQEKYIDQFPKEIQFHFNAWIDPKTWHSGHALDEGRFYKFCWSAIRFGTPIPGGETIREWIMKNQKGKLDASYLEGRANEFSFLYSHLVDFVKLVDIDEISFPSELAKIS